MTDAIANSPLAAELGRALQRGGGTPVAIPPGGGKSDLVAEAIASRLEAGSLDKPCLLITYAALATQWKQQIEGAGKNIRVGVAVSGADVDRQLQQQPPAHVIVTSHGAVTRRADDFRSLEYSIVVADVEGLYETTPSLMRKVYDAASAVKADSFVVLSPFVDPPRNSSEALADMLRIVRWAEKEGDDEITVDLRGG